MSATVLLGLVAAAVSCAIALPQAWRLFRTNSADGVSGTTWAVTLVEELLWLAWALLAREWVAVIPAVVNSPLSAWILFRLWQERRSVAATPSVELAPVTVPVDDPNVIDLAAYRSAITSSAALAEW